MQLEKTGVFLLGVGAFALSVLEWMKLIGKILEQIRIARHPQLRTWNPAWDDDEY